jgi:aspartyl-tRNA(Asn)/glutamyl-tRNA(Gln) amidotransferase subunit C
MSITRETVLHIAQLARLKLDPHEVEALQNDLDKIVGYVAELETLDTTDVPPTTLMASGSASRPDEHVPGLTPAQALNQAPRSIEGGFAVPGFVDES